MENNENQRDSFRKNNGDISENSYEQERETDSNSRNEYNTPLDERETTVTSQDYTSEEQIASTNEAPTNIEEQSTYRANPKKQRNWGSIFLGGIVGGVISAVVVVLLLTSGIIDIDSAADGSNNEEATETSGEPQMIDNLSAEDATVSTDIQEVSEAVVGVVNLQQQSIWEGNQEAGTGSGIVYKKENGKAYVVTNQHVVDGAEQVEVVLNDEVRLPAKVLGGDALTDLAVLEIDGSQINTVANLGSSSDLKVGETVLAIGNPLGLEFANSVTKGIISGLNRSVSVDTNGDGQADWVTEVLQTDAAINPGNSGGALVDAEGNVIGINSMKIAQGAVEGIGFAIPIDSALPIMEQLEQDGEVTRPEIGIATVSLYQVPFEYRSEIVLPDGIEGGMVVANVQPNSAAERAGLQQFDVITKINGHVVTSILELRQFLYSETEVGESIEVEFVRNGETQTTDLQLAEQSN
ncbi:S1C family serine protease [Oceanobacillus piezotolerans]|uniref:S1C family serine protease n=1 Tax=Oceanobacillus piezotolerans TaxID=2448030 RepID=UPI001FE97085|nr:trypsin-like peptidase domain-containing protein [Oceanobacillus piezotolerans]